MIIRARYSYKYRRKETNRQSGSIPLYASETTLLYKERAFGSERHTRVVITGLILLKIEGSVPALLDHESTTDAGTVKQINGSTHSLYPLCETDVCKGFSSRMRGTLTSSPRPTQQTMGSSLHSSNPSIIEP